MKPFLAGLGIIGMLLLFVWERVDIVRVGYRIEQLKALKVALRREQDELRVKVSAVTAPDRLAKAATEKLGMIPPQPGQVIVVSVTGMVPGADERWPEIRVARTERVWRKP
jgi:cell division protein FtsL